MKALLIGLVLFSVLSCQNGQGEEHRSGHTDNSDHTDEVLKPAFCAEKVRFRSGLMSLSRHEKLKRHLEAIYIDGQPRSEDYQPPKVLAMLHPWFKGNLCERNEGGITSYELPEIPLELVAELKEVLSRVPKNGLAILNAEFWAEMRQIQDAGLSVSFIRFSPDFEVSGVYHSDSARIGIDLFANPGTTHHEFRHHTQHQAVGWYRSPRNLSRSCARQASRFLGELDSTTIQLPHWKNSFDGLPTRELGLDEELIISMNPQAGLFYANLNYPSLASGWVQDQGCPRELEQVAREIAFKTDQAKSVLTEKVNLLLSVSASIVHATRSLRRSCPDLTLAEARGCAPEAERIKRAIAQGEKLKAEINSMIDVEAKARVLYTKEALQRLPFYIRYDLHAVSGGFRMIMKGSVK